MRRPPIRIRTFILGAVLVLLLVPTLVGGAAWLIERHHQQAGIERRLNSAVAYLTSHRTDMQEPASVQGFARLRRPARPARPGRHRRAVREAPALRESGSRAGRRPASRSGRPLPPSRPWRARAGTGFASWVDDQLRIPAGTRKAPTTLALDLYYQPASRTTRALVALVSGIVVLLAGLAGAVWLAGRWMVTPLARLSAQVDKVAGGDLTIAVPRSRIGEIANIAQAVEGMTAALGETEQRRAEADEARRFLVTSIAHDLRTPLFALRGHLQAIGSRLGDPAVHLERAEARADALERLVGNLFAYTRDDYAATGAPTRSRPGRRPSPGGHGRPRAHDPPARQHVRARRRPRARGRPSTATASNAHSRTSSTTRSATAPPAPRSTSAGPPRIESTVQITVRDHGPGIDPDLLPHIFEPGIRGTPAAGDADSGAGLGLTIAKRLLEHQHATLTVHNQPTGGAVVGLTLRRAPSADPS